MGWIMDVNFKDEIKQHGHVIDAGAETQVRWDLGIGVINVSGGRIVEAHTDHPLEGTCKEEFEKDLLNFSGVIDSTSRTLCFYKGELANLDFINSQNLGIYAQVFLNEETGTSLNPTKHADGSVLDRSHPDPDKMMAVFEALRKELNEGIVRPHSGDKEVYFDAEDILLDWADKTRTI